MFVKSKQKENTRHVTHIARLKNLLKMAEEEGIEWTSNKIDEKGIRGLEEEKEVQIVFRLIPMRCHWGARSLIGIGGMIALLGVAMIVFTSVKIRLGLVIGTLFSGIIALLIPTNVLVGVCMRADMLCRQGFAQAMTSISILLIAVCALYTVYLAKKKE